MQRHARLPRLDAVAGMLLYAAVNKSVLLQYELLGIPIFVATVDLARDWPDIETELHTLLHHCDTAARSQDEGSVASINAVASNLVYVASHAHGNL
jgi:5-methylcytosine-specific restriction enzyme subunit McrC